jgi:hypothetical protein
LSTVLQKLPSGTESPSIPPEPPLRCPSFYNYEIFFAFTHVYHRYGLVAAIDSSKFRTGVLGGLNRWALLWADGGFRTPDWEFAE